MGLKNRKQARENADQNNVQGRKLNILEIQAAATITLQLPQTAANEYELQYRQGDYRQNLVRGADQASKINV